MGKLEKWQKKKLLFWSILIFGIAAIYIGYTGLSLASDRALSDATWEDYLTRATEPPKNMGKSLDKDAVSVQSATYIDSIDAISVKDSLFSVTFDAIFSWNAQEHPDFNMGDSFKIYSGRITDKELVETYRHEDIQYELFRVSADVNQMFPTKRFPLSTCQLRFYIQPTKDMRTIHMQAMDKKYFGVNKDLTVSGFEVGRFDMASYYYEDPKAERYPSYQGTEATPVYSELLTCVELNRSSWGLYFKCIIALLGISVWTFLTLYVCTNHSVDTMGMISPVLFGVVSNIMVGANLVPDALETGLLEYINIWGIYTIIMITVAIIAVNQIRKKEKNMEFARLFGQVIFIELLVTTVLGHIIIPLSAYQR